LQSLAYYIYKFFNYSVVSYCIEVSPSIYESQSPPGLLPTAYNIIAGGRTSSFSYYYRSSNDSFWTGKSIFLLEVRGDLNVSLYSECWFENPRSDYFNNYVLLDWSLIFSNSSVETCRCILYALSKEFGVWSTRVYLAH